MFRNFVHSFKSIGGSRIQSFKSLSMEDKTNKIFDMYINSVFVFGFAGAGYGINENRKYHNPNDTGFGRFAMRGMESALFGFMGGMIFGACLPVSIPVTISYIWPAKKTT